MKLKVSIILLSLFNCANINIAQSLNQKIRQKAEYEKYTPISIPDMILNQDKRINYLAEHYWDNFDFKDTTLIHNADYTEQAFSNFVAILGYAPLAIAQQSMERLIKSSAIDKTMFEYFTKTIEHYLYDPNSPVRNEEMYIPVLKYLVSCDQLSDVEKIRPRHQLAIAMKNRQGMKATDFVYTLKNGQRHRMYDIKAEYTILFFNHPDCPSCKRVKEQIADFISMSQFRDKLAVLAVYPNDDEDIMLWRQTSYPDFMINGYDEKSVITNKELYDLKASPTLYLLDREKKVILKDTGWAQINQYFTSRP